MSLLDGAIAHPRIFQRHIHKDVQILRNTCAHRRCGCYAKVKLDDDEQEHPAPAPYRGFFLRVPTMPKLGDIESARRLLESAFQNLSFDMSKIPIDSALQGLPFALPKLSIPMPVIVLDITGFVATKLKKPPKKVLEDLLVDESQSQSQYPRCAWPRTVREVRVDEIEKILPLGNLYEQQTPVGPHCAWPRVTGQVPATDGFSSSSSVARYPHSAWPRGSIPANKATLASEALSTSSLARKKKDISSSPCIIEKGPRCAWPRKSVSAKQSHHATERTDNVEQFEAENQIGGKVPPAGFEEAAELPRRMLATSVGLTIMNRLAKGSIVTSFFDLYSLLPAGSLSIPEEEDAAMDVGRRALLVFIKGSDS